ncbi:MAG: GGDEF domain-containing protein, partial [Candidatus Rokubacteria bacterium]|nr:GGDEF domain-containing protein [Candidatus Rokubacteria bacterium]
LRSPELAHLAGALEGARVGGAALPGRALSQPALLAFGLALVLASVRFALRQTLIQSGFLWALLAALLAGGAATGLASTVYLTTGGLVLIIALVETSHHMAYDDELTGLLGRRAFEDALVRLGGQYAIAMVDIDHFKRFNDKYGHDAGDQLLRMVGATLTRTEGGGRAFRYGGEEFVILFPGRAAREILAPLESLRRAVEATAFTLRGYDRPKRKPERPVATGPRRKLSVTVSIGVAESAGREADPREVVKAADRALYRAKHAGRNRVEVEA